MASVTSWCLNLCVKNTYLSKLQADEVKNMQPQNMPKYAINYFEGNWEIADEERFSVSPISS